MKILAVSDYEEAWLTDHFDRERLAGVELVVSCGDLPAWYLEHIVTLANVPLAYVAGNHDTAYRAHAPEGCTCLEGQVRAFRGVQLAGLGGSIRYNDHVFGFTEQEMRWRAARLSLVAQAAGGVDILVTHAPIRGMGDLDDLAHRGFEALDTLVGKLRPRFLLHGHVHAQYGRIERVRLHPAGTTVVNVCGSQVIDFPEADIPTSRRGVFKAEEL